MYGVFITGINMISNIGIGVDDIWNRLNTEDSVDLNKSPIDIPLIVRKSQLRRMSRYAYMGLYTTKQMLDEREEKYGYLDKENIGTIYNTGYGPLVSQLKFGKYVNQHDPDKASPTLFSQTVSNTGVGTICLDTGLKGPSTILRGSNNIGYSFELIKEGKADIIFTGGIEEYCEELEKCYMEINKKRDDINIKLSEASSTILLEKIEYFSDKMLQLENEIYCEVLGYNERNIGIHPLLDSGDYKYNADTFEKNMNKLLNENNIKPEDIDIIVTTKCGCDKVDNAEGKAIEELFGKDICTVSPRMVIGETFGASLTSNVIIAAQIIKKQSIPRSLYYKFNRKIELVIVNSYDVSGNLTSILLKKYTKKR